MFNRMKTVATFAAGAVAGLMLAACLTVQSSRPGVIGGEALILPLMVLLLYVGYELRVWPRCSVAIEHGKENF